MVNGEVVFDAPWQGRLFGMARALSEQGVYHWDEFREHLIKEIADWDQHHQPGDDYHYYDLFLLALTKLLAQKGICLQDELTNRATALKTRPHGHDH